MHDKLIQASWPEWETVRLIGRGSFGSVYEIQRNLHGSVEKSALKVISIPQHESDLEELYSDGCTEASVTKTLENHLQSILTEYQMMKTLNECVNIVNCETVHVEQHNDGIGWDVLIKMELLKPLHKSLPAEITDDFVIKIAKDMCSALEMCKKHGVVHRDIKPQNIFVSPNGNYKLGDFGIAKTVEKTTGGTIIGTYKFMAPEVYNHDPYGSAADIYSLGLVLYWLLNEHRMPFVPLPPAEPTGTEEARKRRFAGEPIPEPIHGSEKLKKIVLKACAFDPKDRYSSATEMRKDLKQLHVGGSGDSETDEDDDELTIIVTPSERPVDPPKDPPKDPMNKLDNKGPNKLPIIVGTVLVAVAILICLLIRGCSTADGVSPTPSAPNETVAEEVPALILPEESFSLYLGETTILHVEGGNGQYSYTSGDKKVVKVDDEGEITAVGVGSATVTVTSGDAVATVTVTIQDYVMALSTDSLSLFTDATATLEVFGLPEDAVVEWRSDNKKVAIVENGEVIAIGEGSARITATWKNGKHTYIASAVVTVETDGVTLSTYQVGSFYIGDTKTINATTSREGLTVNWTSSNNGIVTVNGGKITAVGAGTATITATAGSKSATCTVTVTKPTINLNKSSVSVYIGDSTNVAATTDPGSISVGWSSDNSGVATVSGGKITAVGSGTTTVRAKLSYGGNTYEATCKVTVKEPSVSLSKNDITLNPGASYTIKASTDPSGISVTWSSDNSGIVTVNGGTITAVGAGTTTIRAKISYGGHTYEATCKVKVSDPSVKLDKNSLSLMPGDSARISATTVPGNAGVTWSTSNADVATVNGGNVKAVAEGSATITAKITYGGKEYKATCAVTVEKPSISVTSSSSTIEFSELDKGVVTLTAIVRPDNGKIEWSISDTNIATISGDGTTATVTAKSEGSVTVTATYTANGTTVKDTCNLTVKKAASTLSITNLNYPSRGSVNDFYFTADISSNYQIVKITGTGKATSNALGISVSDNPDPMYFQEGIYHAGAAETNAVTQYLIDQYRSLYTLYVAAAKLLGADSSVTMTITATIHDASGATKTFTIVYVLEE